LSVATEFSFYFYLDDARFSQLWWSVLMLSQVLDSYCKFMVEVIGEFQAFYIFLVNRLVLSIVRDLSCLPTLFCRGVCMGHAAVHLEPAALDPVTRTCPSRGIFMLNLFFAVGTLICPSVRARRLS
jgi:hypothetical protein